MQETANCKIHKLEVTDDTPTSRGGLAFFVKYVVPGELVRFNAMSHYTEAKQQFDHRLRCKPDSRPTIIMDLPSSRVPQGRSGTDKIPRG